MFRDRSYTQCHFATGTVRSAVALHYGARYKETLYANQDSFVLGVWCFRCYVEPILNFNS